MVRPAPYEAMKCMQRVRQRIEVIVVKSVFDVFTNGRTIVTEVQPRFVSYQESAERSDLLQRGVTDADFVKGEGSGGWVGTECSDSNAGCDHVWQEDGSCAKAGTAGMRRRGWQRPNGERTEKGATMASCVGLQQLRASASVTTIATSKACRHRSTGESLHLMDLIFAGKALCTPISALQADVWETICFWYTTFNTCCRRPRAKSGTAVRASRARVHRRGSIGTSAAPAPSRSPPPDTQRLLLCPSDRSLNSQPGLAQVLPTPPQLGGAQVPVAGLWGVAQPPRSGCSRGTPPPPPHCRGAASPAGAPSVWAFSALSPSPFCLCQFCGSRARRRRGGGAAWIPSAAAAVCLGPAWTDAPAGVA